MEASICSYRFQSSLSKRVAVYRFSWRGHGKFRCPEGRYYKCCIIVVTSSSPPLADNGQYKLLQPNPIRGSNIIILSFHSRGRRCHAADKC